MGRYRVDSIIDYSAVQVFKSAAVYPVVFQVTKTNQKSSVVVEVATPTLEDNENSLIEIKKEYKLKEENLKKKLQEMEENVSKKLL
jgi:ribosomal protein S26